MPKKLTLVIICASFFSGSAHADQISQTVRDAVMTNPQVLAAKADAAASEYTVHEAKAENYPEIDLEYDYGRERTGNPTLRKSDINHLWFWRQNRSVEIVQNVFSGFRISNTIDRDKFTYKADVAHYDDLSQTAALKAIEALLNLAKQREIIEASLINIKDHQVTLNKVKAHSASGLGERSQVNIVTSRLILAETELSSARQRADTYENAYFKLIGKTSPKSITYPRIPTKDLPTRIEDLLSALDNNHPAILESADKVASSNKNIKVQRANFYPALDFELKVSADNNVAGTEGRVNRASGMLNLTYNLFRGGADSAKLYSAISSRDAEVERQHATGRVLKEIARNDWYSYHFNTRQIQRYAQYMEYSQKVVDDYLKQFTVGRRDIFEVLGVQGELYSARVSWITARYDKAIDAYRILSDMGNLIPVVLNNQ